MENASKALLIAGSVLIVILLIGVGMIIFNSVLGIRDQATNEADSMAIQSFNEGFATYEGPSISASHVKQLISKINASNVNSSNQIKFKAGSEVTDANAATTVKGSHKYTVTFSRHKSTGCDCGNTETSVGYICCVNIDDNNTTGGGAAGGGAGGGAAGGGAS